MRAHLYRDAHLPEFDAAADDGVDETMERRLANTLRSAPVTFTLLWTRGLTVQIASLQVRSPSTHGWREVLTQRWMDDDGEFSHPLGLFEPGEPVQVMVVAMAMEADVPRIAAAVSLPGPLVKQIIPPPPAKFDTMQRGATWAREGRFSL